MKKIISGTFAILLILLFSSCGSSPEKMSAKIAKLEKEVKEQSPADTVKINELVEAYSKYASKYPKDTLAPEYLFRAGGMCLSFNKPSKAISLFQQVEKDYPSFSRVGECLFMQGFIYENALGDFSKAGSIYREFIAKYPGHPLADDAEMSLKYLGRPAEDIVRDFEKKEADSAAVAQEK